MHRCTAKVVDMHESIQPSRQHARVHAPDKLTSLIMQTCLRLSIVLSIAPRRAQVCAPLRQQDEKAARMLDDVAAKLGTLFWQLNAQQLSPDVVAMLGELAAAVQNLDWQSAQQVRCRHWGASWRVVLRCVGGSPHTTSSRLRESADAGTACGPCLRPRCLH